MFQFCSGYANVLRKSLQNALASSPEHAIIHQGASYPYHDQSHVVLASVSEGSYDVGSCCHVKGLFDLNVNRAKIFPIVLTPTSNFIT